MKPVEAKGLKIQMPILECLNSAKRRPIREMKVPATKKENGEFI